LCNILREDHKKMFLGLLAESVAMFGIEIHSYCLMSNDYHLLICTPHANLSRAIRHIDGVYTQRFNREQQRDGPLFRGRYKSIIVDAENYLVKVSRYIHRNPVEAKIVDNIAEYKWSSYLGYLDPSLCPKWLTTSEVLKLSGSRKLLDYKHLVENPLLPSLEKYYQGHISSILGDKSFRSLIISRAARINDPEIPQSRGSSIFSIETLIKESATALNCAPTDLLSSRRGRSNWPRAATMFVARRSLGYTLNEIALAFGARCYSTVSSVILGVESKMKQDHAIQILVQKIEAKVRKNSQRQT
jgi:putative transposase